MIPLRDSIPSRGTPVVTYLIIGACSFVFFAQLSAGDQGNSLAERYGMVPARVSHPGQRIVVQQQVPIPTPRGVQVQLIERELLPAAVPAWLTVVTCMFLHGGWMHFLGNMWFLYIFGDNVEDRLGHVGFATMYLGTGVVAGLAHYFSGPESAIPTIGASGAIAGVMGAYAWLYPHARVLAVLPLFVVIQTFVLPAPIFLGIWFVLQTLQGISAAASGVAGGVAWWAHIGGFVAGALVAIVLARSSTGRGDVVKHRF